MDKATAKAYESKIKELRKQLKHNNSAIIREELEVVEDAYAWLRTDRGWAQYQSSLSKRREGFSGSNSGRQ